MIPRNPLWTPEEDARLRELLAQGHSDAAIAEAIGTRTAYAVRGRCERLKLKRGLESRPAWQGGVAHAPYWTKERVGEALRTYARTHRGELPRGTPDWDRITKGNPELPTSLTVLKYWPSLAAAWSALIGVESMRKRVPSAWRRYTDSENEYIVNNLSRLGAERVAAHLGRSTGSVRAHAFRKFGMRVRGGDGMWCAADVAREVGVTPRVLYDLVHKGRLSPAEATEPGRPMRFDPDDIPRIRAIVAARPLPPRHLRREAVFTRYAELRAERDAALERRRQRAS